MNTVSINIKQCNVKTKTSWIISELIIPSKCTDKRKTKQQVFTNLNDDGS